jgi:hypothetical protein
MGNKQGSKAAKKEDHIMHYHKMDENKLWVFYPSSELYECYPVFRDEKPFFFGNLETVSIPQLSRVYIIGGSYFKSVPDFAQNIDYLTLKRPKTLVIFTY